MEYKFKGKPVRKYKFSVLTKTCFCVKCQKILEQPGVFGYFGEAGDLFYSRLLSYFFKNKIEVGILEYFVGAEDLSRDWLVLLNYRRFEGIEVFDKEFDP